MLAARLLRSVTAAPRVAIPRSTIPRIALGRRSYAAAAATPQNIKPPIQLFGVDGTYASALYTAAVKANELEQVDKTLQKIKQYLEKSSSMQQVLSAPALDAQSKSIVVQTLSKVVSANKATDNFLNVLAENNRLGLLPGAIEQFSTLMKAHRGEIEAIVTSAQPLDTKILTRLEASISKSSLVGGKKLRLSNKIDSDIIGGLIVEVGDKTIDVSISSKMARLNKLLTEAL